MHKRRSWASFLPQIHSIFAVYQSGGEPRSRVRIASRAGMEIARLGRDAPQTRSGGGFLHPMGIDLGSTEPNEISSANSIVSSGLARGHALFHLAFSSPIASFHQRKLSVSRKRGLDGAFDLMAAHRNGIDANY